MVQLSPFAGLPVEGGREKKLEIFEMVLSQVNDIVVITEAEPIDEPGPRIVWVNEAFVRLTGYSREEVIGLTPRILQGPETRRSELDRIRAAMLAWEPVRAELINYTKAGVKFTTEIEITPLADASGWYTHWVAVQRDVSERKIAEATLNEASRLEVVGQLAGGIAHDFNNLLTVVLGNAEVLIDHLSRDALAQGLAKSIMAAAQRGALLTKRLLAVARQQPLSCVSFDLGASVAEMVPRLCASLGEGTQLSLTPAGEPLPVSCDPTQLESALLNLLLNAHEALGGQGLLQVSLDRVDLNADQAKAMDGLSPGPHARLRVIDAGAGIPILSQAKVFEPFFTTKDVAAGPGLGLAMVRGFVKQSQGDITLESAVGVGTTITILLPLEAAPNPVPMAPSAQAGAGGRIVLFVEDDPMVAEYGRMILEDLGFTVRMAGNGVEALELLRKDPSVHLLFSDVVMPGDINGLELAEAAATLRPDLPVLLASGYFEHIPDEDQRPTGPFRFLPKPYRRQDLARTLSELNVI